MGLFCDLLCQIKSVDSMELMEEFHWLSKSNRPAPLWITTLSNKLWATGSQSDTCREGLPQIEWSPAIKLIPTTQALGHGWPCPSSKGVLGLWSFSKATQAGSPPGRPKRESNSQPLFLQPCTPRLGTVQPANILEFGVNCVYLLCLQRG